MTKPEWYEVFRVDSLCETMTEQSFDTLEEAIKFYNEVSEKYPDTQYGLDGWVLINGTPYPVIEIKSVE